MERTWNRNDSADIRKPRADIHFPFLFSVFYFPLSNFYFEKRGKNRLRHVKRRDGVVSSK